ncbi:MAG: hypothetical protein JWO78_470 [Micavibrio sp.]|nr:hypothetical protein [Micavibrio sp.]
MKLSGIGNALALLLPALIPSWRFFDAIAPSPRIEFALLNARRDGPVIWQEFRPRQKNRLTMGDMVKNLFWNPLWNENLYLVTCAERLINNPADRCGQDIITRLRTSLSEPGGDLTGKPYLQFRLTFVSREGEQLESRTAFTSEVFNLNTGDAL